MSIPFDLIDVFSRRPLAGNPVAIVLTPDADEAGMLAMAGRTGMPETVFVTRPTHPDADCAIRIFSPLRGARKPPTVVCNAIAEGFLEVGARHWTSVLEGMAEVRYDPLQIGRGRAGGAGWAVS